MYVICTQINQSTFNMDPSVIVYTQKLKRHTPNVQCIKKKKKEKKKKRKKGKGKGKGKRNNKKNCNN